MNDAVVWHDVECGGYDADLPLWLALAVAAGGPVLDVGAGTGRVALPLARAGHVVCALDRDQLLLDALDARARAGHLDVACVRADACAFALDMRFALALVPMQTIHLLADRAAFLRCARAVLEPGGLLAVALLGAGIEPFEVDLPPDRAERAGVLFESHPTALRLEAGSIVLERRRERTDATGVRAHDDVVRLADLDAAALAGEAAIAGFAPAGTRTIPPTEDRAGSVVLLLRAPGGRP